MSLICPLAAFAVRQVLGDGVEDVASAVADHFRDHSQTLPSAIRRAHDRAWQSLGVALAGDRMLDRVKLMFASGDDKGVRDQVEAFLKSNATSFASTPADSRAACLDELKRLRKSGQLTAADMPAAELARLAAGMRRHADAPGLVEAANTVVGQVADALGGDYPNLSRLLNTPTPSGPPLLAAAFAFFFRREVEQDDELAHGLFFDGLRHLAGSQAKAFVEVGKALAMLGDRFDDVMDQMTRIEDTIGRVHVTVEQSHAAVLDLQAEMHRLGSLHLADAQTIRTILEQVVQHLARVGMHQGEVRQPHSYSIRGEAERRAVKVLLERFRRLPAEEQMRVPALLNGLGKLQVGAGDFSGAARTFDEVVQAVADPTGKAEAFHNSYRAALEEKKWDDALEAIRKAASLDPRRFAPFPLHRYEPRRILGAGGFGTALLCHDRNFDEEVVVKTLHAADLERGLDEVFREARLLRRLSHPAIIGVRDCEYADPPAKARPYLVMDYFSGETLEQFIDRRGTLTPEQLVPVALQIAWGLQAAHGQGILHRDLKPANALIRMEGDVPQVKVIDFGLALGRQTIETSMAGGAAGNTILSESVAGTLKYAPPEQMGDLRGVKPGPYSDVYAFGRTCCYALFRTTEPKRRQWGSIGAELADLLEKCIEQELEHRYPGFGPVVEVLAGKERELVVRAEEQPQVATRSQREQPIKLTVPGAWFARPVDRPHAQWVEVQHTPEGISAQPGVAYRLDVATTITDDGLAALNQLAGLACLQALNLNECKQVTDVGLAHLKGLLSLQRLDLGGCEQVTDAGLAHLDGLTSLEYLGLGRCARVTDAGLAHLKGLASLQHLYLRGCKQLTDAGLAHLKGLVSLQHLYLRGCMQVTDAGLVHLKGLVSLQYLHLRGCMQVTDAGLAYFEGLASLRLLDLAGCERVTDAGLANLKRLAALRSLSLKKCTQVTDTGLAELNRALPSCKINR
jgi:tRNA A-37 threonylcarbamoyl transferase component Bud32